MTQLEPPNAERRGIVRWVVLGSVLALIVMAALPFLLDRRGQALTYATERGSIERASIGLWLLLALGIPLVLRALTVNVVAGMVTCVAAAAREADMHKSITHFSVLKHGYYFQAKHPLWERALAAAIVVVVSAAVIVVVLAVIRHVRAHRGMQAQWVRILALAMVLGVGSKAIDRLPDLLHKAGLNVPKPGREILRALEEGMECLAPALLIAALVVFARSARPPAERPDHRLP